MGLDITAYERVTLIESQDGLEPDGETVIRLENYPDFRARGDGMTEGFYRPSGKVFHFYGGSYSNYDRFRHELAQLAGLCLEAVWKERRTTGVLVELLDFPDNDGFMGPDTSRKLHADFAMLRPQLGELGWFADQCRDFTQAFRLASHGGAVRFH